VTQIAAILLAAGGGSRMGRTKQLLRAGGQSLVRRAATAAVDAGCRPVTVVTGSDADGVAAEIADLAVQIQLNPDWSAGIGTSIRSGLSALMAKDPSVAAVILLLCDQPHLNSKILRDLMTAWSAAGKPMAACEYAGTLGPPCCFAASMFDQLSRVADSDGAKRLLLANPASVTPVPWPQGADDLDTPADWERFCRSDSHSGPVLRVIDANANRAREALRVMEDYARFILNNDQLSGDIKNFRHELTQLLRPFLPDAILHRDTPGDVGTTLSTPSEKSRDNIADVITASGKRAGEALRALEEFVKILDPSVAAKIEALRYRLYDVEQRLALTLRLRARFADVRLYVLITESACKHPWQKTAELAIEGGADCLQLRENQLPDSEFLARAIQLTKICRKNGIISIINNRPDIALAADADGVHLGQEDMPAISARRILGNDKIIGISTHNLDQARRAVADGADYIGVGPIFKSPTKPRDFLPGLEYAAAAVREIAIPKIGIAGIGPENVDKVRSAGLSAIAVTAAVTGQKDVAGAARELKKMLME
jgi:thiamine-phosphate pyrophosphorylase